MNMLLLFVPYTVCCLQIVHKMNNELVYARLDLQKALNDGGNVSDARKRVGWLEDRVENLLGKRKQRVGCYINYSAFLVYHY